MTSSLHTTGHDARIKPIAFYLPQYHPIPENDLWWGAGFTEWRNVTRATPNFENHYQPHRPADLGYYDLRLPETRSQQAALARQYGIYGFCYYHYWFSGRRILQRPFDEVLATGEPDLPFCLCWANESWTRTWDGREQDVLLRQSYDAEDVPRFIRDLLPAFRDPRYIRVEGKPMLLVYRMDLVPNPVATADAWRREALRAGLPGLHLCAVQFWGIDDPQKLGCDAAVEFPPHNYMGPDFAPIVPPRGIRDGFAGGIYDYHTLVHKSLERPRTEYRLYRGAVPSWDNTARRQMTGDLYINSSPDAFGYWLNELSCQTIEHIANPSDRYLFINAWNEWGEGCHLEPDLRHGHAYLENVRAVVEGRYRQFRIQREIEAHSFNASGADDEQVASILASQQRIINQMADELRRVRARRNDEPSGRCEPDPTTDGGEPGESR